jgi:hypothetical protein
MLSVRYRESETRLYQTRLVPFKYAQLIRVTRVWKTLHVMKIDLLDAEVNLICHLLALLGTHHIQCYGGICRHSTEHVYNDTYTGIRNVILVKHRLWLPDDGLYKPKHVGKAFMTFNCFNSLTV